MQLKLTDKDFKIFETECKKWLEKWKLDEWDIDILWQEKLKAIASSSRDLEQMKAQVYLSKEVDSDEGWKPDIKETAKHEILHILVGKLAEMAALRHVTENELYSCEEQLVNKLMDLL